MASRNRSVVSGIAIADTDGKRNKYFDSKSGKIKDLPTQKMLFDTETGKLMVVVSEIETLALDKEVFIEIDADGFFAATCLIDYKIMTTAAWPNCDFIIHGSQVGCNQIRPTFTYSYAILDSLYQSCLLS